MRVPVTNINDGLLTGISMLNKAREEHKVPERSTSIIIMLTDGDANMGEAVAVAPGSGCSKLLGSSPQGPPWSVSPSTAWPRLPCQGSPPLCPDQLAAVTPPAPHIQESDLSTQSWSRQLRGCGCRVNLSFSCRCKQT